MKTCLSDDHPIRSLLVAGVFIANGTTNWVTAWVVAGDPDFVLFTWLLPLLGLASYGLALYILRNGVSNRSEWVVKLFEPNR